MVDSFAPYAFGYRTYPLALFIVMSLSYIRLLTTSFGDHHHPLQEEIKRGYRLSVKADCFVVGNLQAFFFPKKRLRIQTCLYLPVAFFSMEEKPRIGLRSQACLVVLVV